MGYDLHIARDDWDSITREEWVNAVGQIKELRILKGNLTARNPRTGAEVMVPTSGADVEFYDASDDQWYPVFWWHQGSASFASRPVDIRDSKDPVRNIALKLAKLLRARVVGDEGEVYE